MGQRTYLSGTYTYLAAIRFSWVPEYLHPRAAGSAAACAGYLPSGQIPCLVSARLRALLAEGPRLAAVAAARAAAATLLDAALARGTSALAGRGADGAGRAAGKTGRVQAGDRVVAVQEGMRGIGPPRADHLADVVVRE